LETSLQAIEFTGTDNKTNKPERNKTQNIQKRMQNYFEHNQTGSSWEKDSKSSQASKPAVIGM